MDLTYLRDGLAQLAERFSIKFAILFGSQVRGPTPLSDVDIAVYIGEGVRGEEALDTAKFYIVKERNNNLLFKKKK